MQVNQALSAPLVTWRCRDDARHGRVRKTGSVKRSWFLKDEGVMATLPRNQSHQVHNSL